MKLDCTPSWQAVVSMCCEVLSNPSADRESKESCKAELMRIAKIVDDQIEEAKKNTWTTLDVIVEEERAKGNIL